MTALNIQSISDPALQEIGAAVLAGRRVSDQQLMSMLTTPDVNGLGAISSAVRKERHGARCFYGHSLNVNYTNICELRCPICAFSCDDGAAAAYVLTMDQVREKVTRACEAGADQAHIVGGLNPVLPLDYYRQLVTTVKSVRADMYIVGFTATEYDYMEKRSGIPVHQLLAEFRDLGVDALPGGGAEIFASETRSRIAPKKITADRWLDIMRLAHRAGLKSNATILYNHVETHDDIVDHLRRLRALQDETGGFQALVPLPYHGDRTDIPARRSRPSGVDSLRLFAAARVYLDNVPHLKGLWMYLGIKVAQVLATVAVDDVGATYLNEKIVHAAGASTPDSGSERGLRAMIEQAGFTPVRTTAGYTAT
ncbi:MAG: CofH family radical SAM protein [Lentisphaeria bacterium]|nr:CofH family radical SAM protein [Lentisphaeria bacterium]